MLPDLDTIRAANTETARSLVGQVLTKGYDMYSSRNGGKPLEASQAQTFLDIVKTFINDGKSSPSLFLFLSHTFDGQNDQQLPLRSTSCVR